VEAAEDAGLALTALAGSSTGVYVGIAAHDYASLCMRDPSAINAYSLTGTWAAWPPIGSRIRSILRGPSIAIDTACSSSLAAVHLACQSLRSGECDVALAGGVNVLLLPHATIAMSKAWILSPTGRCRSFDASADGYVRGEGCGVVVLKRMRDVTPCDRVRAIVAASAMNQDGRPGGLTRPDPDAQRDVIRRRACGFRYRAVRGRLPRRSRRRFAGGGRGRSRGDCRRIRRERARGAARRRSVKSSIGHLETASGVASLVKTMLCLERGEIPPQLHFATPHAAFARAAGRITIPTVAGNGISPPTGGSPG